LISGLKRILADVKAKRVTKGTNGMQLIVNGWGLIKQGLSLIKSDVHRRHKK
tara:strand:+ start:4936 stop:5091 length:156 start_codon:yes stop_codon:yes gene_type:complete